MIFAEIIIGLNEISYSFLYENNYTFPTILYKSTSLVTKSTRIDTTS